MRVLADTDQCIGSGMCASCAPAVFELGGDGVVRLLEAHPPASELPGVREAVALCPVQALGLDAERPTDQ
jgi:ferredoxin